MVDLHSRELLAANSSREYSRECLFTLTRTNLTREPVYVTDYVILCVTSLSLHDLSIFQYNISFVNLINFQFMTSIVETG